MEKEDKILLAVIEDKIRQCSNNYTITNTVFLDLHQRMLAENLCRSSRDLILLTEHIDGSYDNPDISGSGRIRALFYGGYPDAERRLLIFLPDYASLSDIIAPLPEQKTPNTVSYTDTAAAKKRDSDDCPLSVLKVRTAKGSRKLTHRDYLGSLMSLGIKRDMTGDIIVREDGADIIILKEISDFLLVNYEKAGRTALSLTSADLSCLDTGTVNIEEKRDTVASLRLDGLVSSVFGLSRGKAQEAVKSGIVFVNNAATLKPDLQLAEGDKLVLRGHGKAVLREISGKSRKDRIYVIFDRYL